MERHIVLVAPDVHWNTGNIGRTCIGTDAKLHLVKPLGFSIEDRHVKRAGLDYWKDVNLSIWNHFDEIIEKYNPQKSELVFFSKLGKKIYTAMPKSRRMFLIFGSETKGLPGEITDRYKKQLYYITIKNMIRSLNLSTYAGIGLYESLRDETDFHQWQ